MKTKKKVAKVYRVPSSVCIATETCFAPDVLLLRAVPASHGKKSVACAQPCCVFGTWRCVKAADRRKVGSNVSDRSGPTITVTMVSDTNYALTDYLHVLESHLLGLHRIWIRLDRIILCNVSYQIFTIAGLGWISTSVPRPPTLRLLSSATFPQPL